MIVHDGKVGYYNAERYADPTAQAALQNVENDNVRLNELIRTLKYVINNAGFELTSRIELKDKQTGKVYR